MSLLLCYVTSGTVWPSALFPPRISAASCPLSVQMTILLSPVDNVITELPAAVKIPKQSSDSPIGGLHSDMHGW